MAEEHSDVLTVPTTALVREKDKAFCVIVVAGKAVRRPIEVGPERRKRAEVVSGLDGSERVVKAFAAALADGQPVEPIELPPPLPRPTATVARADASSAPADGIRPLPGTRAGRGSRPG